eukprot:928481_1
MDSKQPPHVIQPLHLIETAAKNDMDPILAHAPNLYRRMRHHHHRITHIHTRPIHRHRIIIYPSKSYQNEGQPHPDPYDYYSRSHSHSHTTHLPHYNKTYYSPHPPSKSDKSLSPQIMHVPSKAIIPSPSKAPPPPRAPLKASQDIARSKPPPIMEVSSLISKTKQESIDIETTKCGGNQDTNASLASVF